MANTYFDAILPKGPGADIMAMGAQRAQASAGADRSARIAELEAELAEIRKQKASFDDEAEMGRYKFQFEGDPSAYMSYRQNLRSAEQTEKIRKATDDATKFSALKSGWESAESSEMQSQWEAAAWKRKFEDAKAAGNTAAMKEAAEGYSKATALMNHHRKKKESILSDMMKYGGVKQFGAGLPEVKQDENMAYDISLAENNKKNNDALLGRISGLDKMLDLDKKDKYTTKEIKATSEAADKEIPMILDEIEKSSLPDTEKTKLREQMAEIQKKANNWAGTGIKKPTKKLTPEEEKAEIGKKVLDKNGKLRNQTALMALGSKYLKNAKKYYDIPQEWIDELIMQGK